MLIYRTSLYSIFTDIHRKRNKKTSDRITYQRFLKERKTGLKPATLSLEG